MIIALSGYMASGKSSTGRILAQRLGYPFVDLDTVIETRAGRKVKEIFASDGEQRFRELELDAMRFVLQEIPGHVGKDATPTEATHDMVLSLGGGTIIQPAAQKLLGDATVVYLRTSAAMIRRRLGLADAVADRPMLRLHDLETLLNTRAPIYEQTADIIIDTDGLTPDEVAGYIFSSISA